jgi:hypothetical protein
MNCLECQELIQHCLDGEPADAGCDDFAAHLLICPECRDQYAAGQYLLDGLRLLPLSLPPVGLSERICRQILVERSRTRRLHRLLFTSAVAASLVLVAFFAYQASLSRPFAQGPAEPTRHLRFHGPTASASLHDTVEEAGLAIVALTRRTADEVSASGIAFVPRGLGALTKSGSSASETGEAKALRQALEPSAQSLQGIQQDMVASLEPMARSARRAIDFFLHEMSAMENNMQ